MTEEELKKFDGSDGLAYVAYGGKEKELDLMQQKVKDLSLSPIFSARQIALMFFILSHYITDAHMPLHCDLRDFGGDRSTMGRLPSELHPSIEELWESYLPPKETLVLHEHLRLSIDEVVSSLPDGSIIQVDTDDKYRLMPRVSRTTGDEWQDSAQAN